MFNIFLLIIAAILIVFGCVFLFSFIYDAPPIPSTKKSRKKAIELIKKHDNKFGDIVEIGTGWGGLTLMLAKEFPTRNIITYEISFIPYLCSKILFKLLKINNIKTYNKDAFKQLSSGAIKPSTIVYYLCDTTNIKVREIYKESNDVLFVCNTYAMDEEDAQPLEVIDSEDLFKSTIYAYKNNQPSGNSELKKPFIGML